jgi:RHS repeat-associated protein
VFQTGTTTTYLYPFKWYSVASSTGSGAKFATTTDYVFNGDSLVATIDQQTATGNATGTAKTRYIHPDHLGSTNVVTDENDNVVQTLDYYPYGSTRVSSATSTNERRKYIGQFSDDAGLSYLNARYYEGSRGQFLSEDPVFWGNPKGQNLMGPQSLNAYAYAEDNPITKSDSTGKCVGPLAAACLGAGAGMVGQFGYDVYNNVQSGGWGNALSHFSSREVYLTRAGQGASIALAAEMTGGMSLLGQMAVVGGTSGTVSAGGSWYLGDPITAQGVLTDAAFGAVTFGAGEFVPAVPGRLPAFGSDAFFFGSHTQQSAMRLGVDAMSNFTSAVIGGFNFGSTYQSRTSAAQSYNTSVGASTGGGGGGGGMPSNNSLWVTPSGAVVTWGGSLVVGPTAQSTPSTVKKYCFSSAWRLQVYIRQTKVISRVY